ncbi:molybdopterin/thiamine biosynthesis adenylyltransferase [Streptomyces sp. SAI-170]|uniref:ThiF family adenylyltransferase n=1 Tax=Streptomyces sp. SAI-170 TaxID=3377729 RepID=UPI003C79F620
MTAAGQRRARGPEDGTPRGRYARHALVPGWDQQRLAGATVVLAGAGALGNAVAQSLALAGLGRLVVTDPDTVEVGNLSRTPLFRAADVGRPKARVLAEALAGLAPDTVVDAREAPHVSGVGLAELREADLVVAALDSRAARISLAGRCTLAGTGLLDGGTHPWGGETCWYPPGGRCRACGLTPAERAVQDDPWSCAAPGPLAPAGASAPVSALVGAWLANFAVRLLLRLSVPEGPLRIDAAGSASPLGGAWTPGADPDCPLHERLPGQVPVLPLDGRATVGELLARVGAEEEPLTWAGFARPVPGRPALRSVTTRLRAAPAGARLVDLGVAPREILPVARRDGTGLRYVELAPAGDDVPGVIGEGGTAGGRRATTEGVR